MSPKSSRITIGLIIDQISSFGDNENFQSMIISGVADYAHQHDIHLICFVAGKIFSPLNWERSRTILLEFVQPGQIDGLIVLSTAIGIYVNKQSVYEMLDKFTDFPIVTIGQSYDRYFSVFTSSYNGMKQNVNHLILEHDCRKMAFIRGPAGGFEAESRFTAYKDALKEHGIPFDPKLVYQGNFLYNSGSEAVEYLVNNQISFDAIISANDNMALGVITQLRNRFGSIPVNLPVVGFDDAAFSKQLGLTTVRQAFHELAMTAADVLNRTIAGETVAKDHEIPTSVVIRSTCGCIPSVISNASHLLPHTNELSGNIDLEHLKTAILNEIHTYQSNLDLDLQFQADETIYTFENNLVDAFVLELFKGRSNYFYEAWGVFIFWLIEKGGSLYYLHDILSSIRRQTLSQLIDPNQITTAENLFHSARVQISGAIGRTAASSYYHSSLQTADLDQFSEELFVDLDIDKQMQLIEDSLSKYGMTCGFIVLYDDPDQPMTTARLIMAFIGEERLNIGKDGLRFTTKDLLPQEIMSRLKEQRTNTVVLALHHGDSKLGYAIFGFEHKINRAFEVLRQRLSIALKGAVLMTNAKNQTIELEHQVTERTKEISETNQKLLIEIEKRQEAELQLRKALDELAELNEDLRALSVRDELTGILNRRGFMERGGQILQSSMHEGEAFLIMFADMDKLKSINDQYGHEEGDRAITMVTDILKFSLPASSVIARLGGDEFTAIIPLTHSDEAESDIRQRIAEGFATYSMQSKLAYTLSISMGFALYTSDSSLTFNELIKLADDGLYSEKRKKRDQSYK